jgi:transposase
MHLQNIDYLTKQIKKLDEEIEKMVPQKESKLIQTIPGISEVNASAILAEIGNDMSQFPDEAHLPLGRAYAQAITRVQERRRAEKRRKVIPF